MHQAHHPELLQRSCRFAIQLIEGNGPFGGNGAAGGHGEGMGGAWGEVEENWIPFFWLVEIYWGVDMVGCLIIWGG